MIGRATVFLVLTDDNEHRICGHCQARPLAIGYLVNDGDAYYCSEACFKDTDWVSFNALQENGADESTYWTDWSEAETIETPNMCRSCDWNEPLYLENDDDEETGGDNELKVFCCRSCVDHAHAENHLAQIARIIALPGASESRRFHLIEISYQGECNELQGS